MEYFELRQLHIACALLSVTLFCVRAALRLAQRAVPRVLRWLPHLNDTVLLTAALSLAVWSGQYPFQQHWLTAKVIALLLYIGFGKQALKPDLSVRRRLPWLLGALVSVIYIFAVATTRRAFPF